MKKYGSCQDRSSDLILGLMMAVSTDVPTEMLPKNAYRYLIADAIVAIPVTIRQYAHHW